MALAVLSVPWACAQVPANVSWTSDLLQASDGNFYGAALLSSSPTQVWEIFSITPDGTFTVINPSVSGDLQLCEETPEGAILGNIYESLVTISFSGEITNTGISVPCPFAAPDGNYYGIEYSGGAYNEGYLFQMTPAGKVTDVYDFTAAQISSGYYPSLISAVDGYLYGITATNIIRFSVATGYTLLAPGSYDLSAGLAQAADGGIYFGSLYGYDSEAIYRFDPSTETVTLFYAPDDALEKFYVNGAGLLDTLEANGDEDECTSDSLYVNSLDASGNYAGNYFQLGDGSDNELNYATPQLTGNGSYIGFWEQIYEDYGNNCNTISDTTSEFQQYTGPAPIAMSLSPTNLLVGHSATLTWQANEFGGTMQQCYGYGALSGKVALSGSNTITPTQAGIQTTAIVCGGRQTSFVKLSAGVTQLALSASQSSIGSGSPLTLTAQIGNVGTPSPTGSVEFLYNGAVLATSKITSAGTATFTANTSGIPPGTYSITAKYLGDGSYAAATTSAVTITVVPKHATSIALTPASQSAVVGGAVTFNVSVSGAASQSPTGAAQFYTGTLLVGSATLTQGGSGSPSTATFSASTAGVPAGTYPVVAKYQGDPYNSPSNSSAVTVTLKNGDSVSVTASPNPVPASTSFLLTATATGTSGTPTGTVFFYAGSEQIASHSLNSSGVSQITVPAGTLAAGSYQVTAQYAGDSKDPAVTSTAITLTVQ